MNAFVSNYAIELNWTELHRTKLAYNRPPYTKRFICNDNELTTIKRAPPNVIMQNYLASYDTPRHFDWLCILQIHNMLRASHTPHTKRRDWTAFRNLNLRRKLRKPPHIKGRRMSPLCRDKTDGNYLEFQLMSTRRESLRWCATYWIQLIAVLRELMSLKLNMATFSNCIFSVGNQL